MPPLLMRLKKVKQSAFDRRKGVFASLGGRPPPHVANASAEEYMAMVVEAARNWVQEEEEKWETEKERRGKGMHQEQGEKDDGEEKKVTRKAERVEEAKAFLEIFLRV